MPAQPPPQPQVEDHAEHNAVVRQEDDPSLDRIGAFSDGVFAFAITLLILSIRIPHPSDPDANRGLLTLLIDEWRSYLAFVLSFMLVGINWANHRVMFGTFARADHTLVWLNLLYLMLGVALMPVPTAVLGAWLGSPKNQVVAAVFYGAAATIGGLPCNILSWDWGYVAQLTSPPLTARHRTAPARRAMSSSARARSAPRGPRDGSCSTPSSGGPCSSAVAMSAAVVLCRTM